MHSKWSHSTRSIIAMALSFDTAPLFSHLLLSFSSFSLGKQMLQHIGNSQHLHNTLSAWDLTIIKIQNPVDLNRFWLCAIVHSYVHSVNDHLNNKFSLNQSPLFSLLCNQSAGVQGDCIFQFQNHRNEYILDRIVQNSSVGPLILNAWDVSHKCAWHSFWCYTNLHLGARVLSESVCLC